MRDFVRSTVTTGIALTAAGAIAVTPPVLPVEYQSPQTAVVGVRLSASTTLLSATPPLGALLQQFLRNQVTDCSLICPSIIQFATQPLIKFAVIPVTFVRELQSGEPLLQAIALTDATVSGAANDALTGIITNDLAAALPRAQHSLEVAVIGLINIGTTAVTAPGNLRGAITTARVDLFSALQQPPGPTPPAVHSVLQAAAVRAIEVASALTFQAPERLLLGVTQAANALFTTLGETGNVTTALGAVRTSVRTTVSESVDLVRHALKEPIPISPAAATTTNAMRARHTGARRTPATSAAAKATLGSGRKHATAATPGRFS
jgi:hypothetical protein